MSMGVAGNMKQNIGIWRNQGKSGKWCGKHDATEKEGECVFYI